MNGREALRIIADEVVGVSNPDWVHDDEMLRWARFERPCRTGQSYRFSLRLL